MTTRSNGHMPRSQGDRIHRDRIKIGPKKKIAFVCSGGATKAGAFHLGVALALQEQGFRFYGGLRSAVEPSPNLPAVPGKPHPYQPQPMEISTYVGSSAGSIISSYLAAGYSLDNIFHSFRGRSSKIDPNSKPKPLPSLTYQKMFKLRSNPSGKLLPRFSKDHILGLARYRRLLTDMIEGNWEALLELKWLSMTGVFSTSGIEQYMREEVLLSNHFHDYSPDLFIVATQLNHSRKVVFGKTKHEPPPHDLTCQYDNDVPISEACAASTALPVIFSPFAIKTKDERTTYYIDGEIRDTLSTHVAVDSGADLVIASYSHQPYHCPGDLSLTDHGLTAVALQSIYLLIEQKINNHIYNKTAQRNAIDSVSLYCKSAGIPDQHRQKILDILQQKLSHRMDVDTIYIHPSPNDAELFFGDHFTLNPIKMMEVAKSGFRAAIETLRKYDFADRKEKHAMGEASTGVTHE